MKQSTPAWAAAVCSACLRRSAARASLHQRDRHLDARLGEGHRRPVRGRKSSRHDRARGEERGRPGSTMDRRRSQSRPTRSIRSREGLSASRRRDRGLRFRPETQCRKVVAAATIRSRTPAADAEWAKAVVGTLREARQLRPSGRPSSVVGGLPECEPDGAGTLVQPVHGIVSVERALVEGARGRDQPSCGRSVRLRAPSVLRCRGRSRIPER